MDEENRELLEERLTTITTLIESEEVGSDKYRALCSERESIARVLNEDHKLTLEERRQTYESLKDDVQEKERKWDRIINGICNGAKIVAGAASTYLGWKAFRLALGFESGGTFRSKSAIQALNRVLSGKF